VNIAQVEERRAGLWLEEWKLRSSTFVRRENAESRCDTDRGELSEVRVNDLGAYISGIHVGHAIVNISFRNVTLLITNKKFIN
jgi:hypothetical protein